MMSNPKEYRFTSHPRYNAKLITVVLATMGLPRAPCHDTWSRFRHSAFTASQHSKKSFVSCRCFSCIGRNKSMNVDDPSTSVGESPPPPEESASTDQIRWSLCTARNDIGLSIPLRSPTVHSNKTAIKPLPVRANSNMKQPAAKDHDILFSPPTCASRQVSQTPSFFGDDAIDTIAESLRTMQQDIAQYAPRDVRQIRTTASSRLSDNAFVPRAYAEVPISHPPFPSPRSRLLRDGPQIQTRAPARSSDEAFVPRAYVGAPLCHPPSPSSRNRHTPPLSTECTNGCNSTHSASSSAHPSISKKTWARSLVEIAPGYSVPLIGSEETWDAYCEKSVRSLDCTVCRTFLFCADAASMVLCPICRNVGPVVVSDEDNDNSNSSYPKAGETSSSSDDNNNNALGLGLTVASANQEWERRRTIGRPY